MTVTDFNLACLFWLFISTSNCSTIRKKYDLTILSADGSNVTQRYFDGGKGECHSELHFDDPKLMGQSTDRPATLKVTPYYKQDGDEMREWIDVQWQLPEAVSSREALKGFYLQINWKTSERVCRVYRLKPLSPTEDLTFSFRTGALVYTSLQGSYDVKVYSLPAASKDIGYGQVFFRLIKPYGSGKVYPGDWEPSIRYRTSWDQHRHSGIVDVYFNYPPNLDGWLLKDFLVMLFRRSGSTDHLCGMENVTKELNSNDTTEAHVRFDELPKGSYQIKVKVVNYESQPPFNKLCICAKRGHCDTACGKSSTSFFDLVGYRCINSAECNDTDNSTTTPPMTNWTDVSLTTIETPRSGKDVSIYIAATVCVVIVFFIGFLTTSYLWRRQKRGSSLINLRPGMGQKAIDASLGLDKRLPPKTVFIIAVTDHPESVQLVKSFSSFLTVHCHCSVIDPRDADLSQICESAWVTSVIQKCDCIIFINSKEGAQLIGNFLNKVEVDSDPYHSIAYKALQIAFNADLKCHFNIVTFTEDWAKDILAVLSPKKYVLPKQLPQFTRELHNVSESTVKKMTNLLLPFTPSHLVNNPEWKSVLQAVAKVKILEDRNPECISSTACMTSESNRKLITKESKLPESDGDDMAADQEGFCFDYPDSHSGQTDMVSNSYDVPCGQDGVIPQLPGAHVAPKDWESFVTFAVVSDIHPNEAQENDKFRIPDDDKKTSKSKHVEHAKESTLNNSELNVHNELDELLPEETLNDRDHTIVPPKVITLKGNENVDLTREDSISNKLTQINDDLSQWSEDAGYETINDCQMKNGEESGEKSAHIPKVSERGLIIIKSPYKSVPTDDISLRLRSLNEEVGDEYCIYPQDMCCNQKTATVDEVDEINV